MRIRSPAGAGVVVLGAAFAAVPAAAHPGNGIVVSADGTCCFADVGRRTIWKLDPGGTLTALRRETWTHSLFLGPDGTLYYEREEPVEGVAPCSLWQVTPAGEHRRLVAPERDRRRFAGGPFVVDPAGNVYFAFTERDAEGGWRTRLMRRTSAGEIAVFSGAGSGELYRDGPAGATTIRIVTAIALGPEGRIHFADRDHVRRVAADGTVTTVAAGLLDEAPVDPPDRRGPPTTINRLYGLSVAADGSIQVAYRAGRRVIEIDRDGTVATILESRRPWSPLGVAVRGESRYVLETSAERGSGEDRLRVRRIDGAGGVETLVIVDDDSP